MPNQTLSDWVQAGPFTLALSPGFFGFYAQVGALQALSTVVDLLPGSSVYACCGCSSGAITASFLAAGISVDAMERAVLKMQREHIWDLHLGRTGLLRGGKMVEHLDSVLSDLGASKTFEDCLCPVGVTAFHLPKLRIEVLRSGPLSSALSASACVPGLFSPVEHCGMWPLVDGAIGDPAGLAACPALPPATGRILHVGFPGSIPGWRGVGHPSQLPQGLVFPAGGPCGGVDMISLVLDDTPTVSPFNMQTMGPVAVAATKAAVIAALTSPLERAGNVILKESNARAGHIGDVRSVDARHRTVIAKPPLPSRSFFRTALSFLLDEGEVGGSSDQQSSLSTSHGPDQRENGETGGGMHSDLEGQSQCSSKRVRVI